MMFLRRMPRDLSPLPAEVLSQAELARAARFKRAYTAAAVLQIDSLRDAARTLDHLEFLKWLLARGRVGR